MTGQFVEHDGLRFRCQLDGPESAPWLVFSNSLVTDLTLWEPQVSAFAGRFRILRYDQRGHGGTGVPNVPATIAQLADDAAALLAHFSVRDAVFVGVSMGAATGFRLAQRHPELVARLVASDGNIASPPSGAQAWQERIDLVQREGMKAYADVTLVRWFAARSRNEDVPALAQVRVMIEATPREGFIACARALQDYNFSAGAGVMRQPTLLIAGAEDGAIPAALRALQPQLPDAHFVEITDAGHLPGIERPAAFNAALAAFLE